MVSVTVILHLQTDRLLLDRSPVDRCGNNTAADAVWILDQDFIACRAESDRHLEARPGVRDARVQTQDIALQAQPENTLDARPLHPSSGTGVPRPAAASGMGRVGIDIGGDDVGFHLVTV